MKRSLLPLATALFAAITFAESPPLCKVVVNGNGPAILMNGKPVSPLFISVGTRFGREETYLAEVREAAKVDVDLVSFDMSLDWDGATDTAQKTLEQLAAANPRAWFYPRVSLAPSAGWLDAHGEARAIDADGKPGTCVSTTSALWLDEAERLLREKLDTMLAGPQGARLVGVCLTGPVSGKWAYAGIDYSDSTVESYRAWLKKKYLNDKALRRAWGSADASVKTAVLPRPEMFEAATWGPFRSPARQLSLIDFEQYLNDSLAAAIADFAAVVKRSTHARGLVGVEYGATLETGTDSLARTGQIAFGALLNLPDVNIIHAPYSSLERALGNPGHFPLLLDSTALHNKLVVIDEDSRTNLAQTVSEAPAQAVSLTTTLEETFSLSRRNVANFLTHRAGMAYADPYADGRWSTKEFWTPATLTRRMFAEARTPEPFQPQIAVLVSEDALRLMAGTGTPYASESIANWRAELDRVGTPVGYYLQSDLPRLPESLHVIILANAYTIAEPERRALDKFLAKGGTVVWTFAPDIVGEEGPNVARISDVTGMQVGVLTNDGAVRIKSAVTEEAWQLGEDWKVRFEVTSTENVHAIAHYEGTESVAVAATPLKGGISVFTAVPRLPVGMLRWIGTNSAVHFYSNCADMVGIFGPYFVVHTSDAGPRTFKLPAKVHAIERLVPHINLPLATDTDTWQETLPAKTTVVYTITPQQ